MAVEKRRELRREHEVELVFIAIFDSIFFFLRLIMSTPYLSAYVNTAFVWGVFGKLEKLFSSKEIIDYYFF